MGFAQGVVPLDPGLRAYGAQGCRETCELAAKYRRSATGLAARWFGVVSLLVEKKRPERIWNPRWPFVLQESSNYHTTFHLVLIGDGSRPMRVSNSTPQNHSSYLKTAQVTPFDARWGSAPWDSMPRYALEHSITAKLAVHSRLPGAFRSSSIPFQGRKTSALWHVFSIKPSVCVETLPGHRTVEPLTKTIPMWYD